MFLTLKSIFKNKLYRKIFIILNIIFVFLYFVFNNFLIAIQNFSIPFFSTSQKFSLFLSSLFDISELRSINILILVILTILSISIFSLLFYILFKKTGEISKKKSIWGSVGLFISILGLSCAACGIGLLFSILSLFGITSAIVYFPLHGLEFGFLGVIILNIINYLFLKRLKNPFVC